MQDYSPSRIGSTLVGSQPTDRRQKQLWQTSFLKRETDQTWHCTFYETIL